MTHLPRVDRDNNLGIAVVVDPLKRIQCFQRLREAFRHAGCESGQGSQGEERYSRCCGIESVGHWTDPLPLVLQQHFQI